MSASPDHQKLEFKTDMVYSQLLLVFRKFNSVDIFMLTADSFNLPPHDSAPAHPVTLHSTCWHGFTECLTFNIYCDNSNLTFLWKWSIRTGAFDLMSLSLALFWHPEKMCLRLRTTRVSPSRNPTLTFASHVELTVNMSTTWWTVFWH